MQNLLEKQSMKAKLLSLIFISFMLTVVGLGIGIIMIQKNLLHQMEFFVAKLLTENNKQIKNKFAILGNEVTQSLDRMPESVGSKIAAKTTHALNGEKDIVSSDFEQSLQRNMESLAALMAKVAPAAILSNDFITLISYVKSASSGEDVIYAVYLKPDGRPLTRYYDKQHPKIKEFIKISKEKKKINKILQASQNDPDVMMFNKEINLEGKILGSVVLCASKKSMDEKIAAMEQRFLNLIESNGQETTSTLNYEAKNIIEQFLSRLNSISASNSEAVEKAGVHIRTGITDVEKKISTLIMILGCISMIIICAILFFVISRITQKINRIAQTIGTGSVQVTQASEQVSISSQNLADVSSRQASAIEETSTSMEEMSSMTKMNADNANQANTLMKLICSKSS